ncbi:MAG: protein kinase domain-containing protein [Polyangiaceae bacterium]
MPRPHDPEETAPGTGLSGTPGDYGIPPGTRAAGRYILGERLGAGGMGIVYSAHDERLDRRVALKLLRPDASGDGEAHRQLVREAKTLARLAHPNVVTVHDIGDFEGRVYIEMELVNGSTLTRWLHAGERTWQEVVDVFVQAGRGLAAAHAVGIVHRDFKPDNVLVGDDGRVRVADFGIALLAAQAARAHDAGASAGEDADAQRSDEPTGPNASPAGWARWTSGGRTGTPAYMAPEQRRDGTADARSDQYSFCVALHEALFDALPSSKPGAGTSPATAKRFEPPAWLEQAIRRGLARVPTDRYPDMDALLDVLVSQPKRRLRRRRAALMGVFAAALLSAGVVWGSVRSSARAGQVCRGAEAKVAGVWDDARKGPLERAFLATGKPFAADAWHGVQGALDAYAHDWALARTDACEATRVRKDQSEQLLDLRMSCLDERLQALGALTESLAAVDGDSVSRAFQATQRLPSIAPCGDRTRLLSRVRPPDDPATAARVAVLQGRIARIASLSELAKYHEALDLARALTPDAAQAGYPPVHAKALYWEGKLLGQTGDTDGAERTLRRAESIADAAGDDALRVTALGQLLFFAAGVGHKFDLIPDVDEKAKAALARLGPDDDVEFTYLIAVSMARGTAGDRDLAREADEKAVAVARRGHGEGSWREGLALSNLGNDFLDVGETEKAIDLEKRALAIYEKDLGPFHPYVAAAEADMAYAYLGENQPALAEPHIRRAIALREGTLGDEDMSKYFNGLGEVLLGERRLDEALASYERGMAAVSATHSAKDPALLESLAAIGNVYVEMGKPALGIPYLESALALPSEGPGFDAARAKFALARAFYGVPSKRARARTLLSEAEEMLKEIGESWGAPRLLKEIEEWVARDGGAP